MGEKIGDEAGDPNFLLKDNTEGVTKEEPTNDS
jgi:hypothetical protein